MTEPITSYSFELTPVYDPDLRNDVTLDDAAPPEILPEPVAVVAFWAFCSVLGVWVGLMLGALA